jgi:quinol monooxygenase YgiN
MAGSSSLEGNEPRQLFIAGRKSALIRLTCAAGMRPALLEVLNTYVDSLADEPGTEMFMVHIDPDDENNVWLYETFLDDSAALAHRSTAGFAKLMNDMPPLLDAPAAILRMEPLRMSVQESVLTEDWSL